MIEKAAFKKAAQSTAKRARATREMPAKKLTTVGDLAEKAKREKRLRQMEQRKVARTVEMRDVDGVVDMTAAREIQAGS